MKKHIFFLCIFIPSLYGSQEIQDFIKKIEKAIVLCSVEENDEKNCIIIDDTGKISYKQCKNSSATLEHCILLDQLHAEHNKSFQWLKKYYFLASTQNEHEID